MSRRCQEPAGRPKGCVHRDVPLADFGGSATFGIHMTLLSFAWPPTRSRQQTHACWIAAAGVCLLACGRSDLDPLQRVDPVTATTSEAALDATRDSAPDATTDAAEDSGDEWACDDAEASPPPDAGYLETCTGCSVVCGSLRCTQCQTVLQAWVTTPPLALPCSGQVENCNGTLTCVSISALDSCFPPGSYGATCEYCAGDGKGNVTCDCLSNNAYIPAAWTGGYCAAGLVNCAGVLQCGGC
jgi:hypothetical protein